MTMRDDITFPLHLVIPKMKNLVSALDKPRLSVVTGSRDTRLRILLVDSDSDVSLVLRREFEAGRTAQLDFVSSAESAMQVIASQHYDLVAVDPTLPGGFDVLKHVKETQRWTATLVMTGSENTQILREAMKCRADGLLLKPVLPFEFVGQALMLAGDINARQRTQQRRVLAIGANPDDIAIGCGGALAKHNAHGDVLRVLILMRGVEGGDVNRTIQAQRAAETLGAALEMAELPATRGGDGVEAIEIIESAIQGFRPTEVYTHCAEDTHQDHRAVHSATLVAARNVSNLYCYQTSSSTVDFQPNRFVDITNFMPQKLRAIDTSQRQSDRMDALHHDYIQATARYWGRYASHVLAEPFRVIRQHDGDAQPRLDRQVAAPHSNSAVAG